MPNQSQFEPGLHRILWTLRDYSAELIVIGGWVPHLYHKYGGFRGWTSGLSRTGEVDVLVPSALPAVNRPPISNLLHAAGFVPTMETGAAAVWEKDPVAGEQIEFLAKHQGTAKQIGQPALVTGQLGVSAIALTDMDLMMTHVTTLGVPITEEGHVDTLQVRVPTLGAFIATKSATFVRRRPLVESGITRVNPKAAKDLVYVRDLMAAGREVVDRIEADLASVRKDSKGRTYVKNAERQVKEIIRFDRRGIVDLAAREIAERDHLTLSSARAGLVGYLTDCIELLRG